MKTKPRINQIAGFTMIELISVIVILGILVSFAVPNYIASVERAKCTQAIHVLKTMRNAAISFFTDNQTFVGITPAILENQVGARFFSGDDNSDWQYLTSITTADVIQVQANRLGGAHGGTSLSLTDNIAAGGEPYWGGDYPLIENIILFDN